jgi:hypothetical protein
MTAQQLVATFSETELSEVCAAINTMQNEAHDATSAVVEQESEAIQVLTKLNRTSPVAKSVGSTSKGGDTTHLVPMAATGNKASTIISVKRLPITRADQEATQLKCALAKVNASLNGHRNRMFSLRLIVDDAPESPPLLDTNDE